MTTEERIAALEAEIASMKSEPRQRSISPYTKASQRCDAYFEQTKIEGQDYGAYMMCAQAARDAFISKRRTTRQGRANIWQYLLNQEDEEEYFTLFKTFLNVYQGYLKEAN